MKKKIIAALVIAIIVLVAGIAVGSVYVPPQDIVSVMANKLFGFKLPEHIKATTVSIVWNLRLPRVLLAFIVGGSLSVSGAVMQSVLRNPLASSYTLGVSSGASLGAGIVLLCGFTLPVASLFTLPVMGFIFGIGTIMLAITFSLKIDGRLDNNTIILTGMIISLFISAVVTLMSAFAREHVQRLIFWQMGSFSLRDWSTVYILLPIFLAVTVFIARFAREMDMLTFGEEQAKSMGVNTGSVKWLLLVGAALLTGSAISFVGVIGFVDLVAPHIVRKIYGSAHRALIPMAAVVGGSFMIVCDLAARTIVPKHELPVGAVTALIGAPFFAYVYFSKRKRAG